MDYKVGDQVRVWFGLDFIRSGRILALRGDEAYIAWDYDLPSEWIPLRKMC